VKFYTEEGTFDLVGNNIPVFFIQDGIKFPDIIHAAKPHSDREIPQAQSAHGVGPSRHRDGFGRAPRRLTPEASSLIADRPAA
jgi:hypothetical protein